MSRWCRWHIICPLVVAREVSALKYDGPRNSYPSKLGVVEEGALADLVLVNCNPLENISLIDDPDKLFLRS